MFGEWQPIETAPDDGCEILLYDGRSIFTGQWEDSYISGFTDHRGHDCGPTHWMPLPTPPSDGG